MNLLSQLPLLGLSGANKNIRLINKKMRRGRRESQGTCPIKVENYKWLSRSKMNKGNTDRAKIKKKKRGES